MSSPGDDLRWLEELGRRELRPGPWTLEPIRAILGRLGNPEERFGALHVAGTRGKGSTCALLASALGEAGIRAGLTTSPHLTSPCERIRVDGRAVSAPRLVDLVRRVRVAADGFDAGYFEVMTAAAFLAFAEDAVDVAVVEVGLGGRLDATNVVYPVVTAITRLGLDHADRLGTTRAEIAREKAGILKAGVPAILAPNHPEATAAVLARAAEIGAFVRCLTEADIARAPRTSLAGAVQAENAAVAAAVLEAMAAQTQGRLVVPREVMEPGFLAARWPARLELMPAALSRDPQVDLLLDVAHDVDSVVALCEHVAERPPFALVFSCLQAKDLEGIARVLAAGAGTRGAVVLVPELDAPRARPAAEVVAALAAAGIEARAATGVAEALAEARRMGVARVAGGRPPLVAAFGSFVIAGEVMRVIGRDGA